MPVTFGGNLPQGFTFAMRQHVHEMQAPAEPQVEWNWWFTAIPGEVGVHLRIPAREVDKTGGGDLGKEFIFKISADAEAARSQLSKWSPRSMPNSGKKPATTAFVLRPDNRHRGREPSGQKQADCQRLQALANDFQRPGRAQIDTKLPFGGVEILAKTYGSAAEYR